MENSSAPKKRRAAQGVIQLLEAERCVFPRRATEVSQWEYLTLAELSKVSRALSRVSSRVRPEDIQAQLAAVPFDRQLAQADFYRAEGYFSNPTSFYQAPSELPAVCVSAPHSVPGGEVSDISFRSRYVPRAAAYRDEFYRAIDNLQVHAKVWRHTNTAPLGTIVAVHGWKFGDARLSALTLLPGYFFRLGLDVIVYELPFHGRRASESEESFPSPNIFRTVEGFGQAIYELRSLAAWETARTGTAVSVVGMSLGGYVAALWASLDAVRAAVCVTPLVSISTLVKDLRLSEADDYLQFVDEVSGLHAPLRFPPQVPAEARLIVCAENDSITPVAQAELLWEHWGRSAIIRAPGEHISAVVQPQILRQLHDFLRENNLAFAEPLPLVS